MPNEEMWKDKHYSFYQNRECEFFPCHPTEELDSFNCLFCYCPLYALGSKCGGNFRIEENGIKNCEACMIPHKRENYGYIVSRFKEIVEMMKKNL